MITLIKVKSLLQHAMRRDHMLHISLNQVDAKFVMTIFLQNI